MYRVIRKRVRRQKGEVNLVADVDAAVAANTGTSGERQRVKVRSRHSERSPRARRDDPADTEREAKEEP